MDQDKPFRIALIGLGRAGQFHLQSLRTLPQIELAHVVDVDPEQAARIGSDFNCASSTQMDAALEDDSIEAVIVATPTGEHYQQIIASLNAGKAVFHRKTAWQRFE